MKYLSSYFLSGLFFLFGIYSQAQFLESSESPFSSGNHMTTDQNDNIYIAGDFVCEISAGDYDISLSGCDEDPENPSEEVSEIPRNMFLLKSDDQGNVTWLIGSQIEANDDVFELKGIAPVGTSGLLAAGTYENNFNLGGLTTSTTSTNDLFISHIDNSGNVTDLMGGFSQTETSEISINGVIPGESQDVWIYGQFSGKIEIDGTVYTAETPKLIALRVDSDLNLSVEVIGKNTTYDGDLEGENGPHEIESETNITAAVATGNDLVMAIEADDLTSLTAFGETTEFGSGEAIDDNGTMTWQAEETINLVRINSDGTTTVLKDDIEYSPFVIEENTANNFLLASNYEDAGHHCKLTEYDETGTSQWETEASTSGTDFQLSGRSLAIDENDNIYLGGGFGDAENTGNFSIEGNTYDSNDAEDGFVIKLLPDGSVDWVQTAGNTGEDQINALTAINETNVIAAGEFTSEITFGERILENTVGLKNMFWGVVDPYPEFDVSFSMATKEICEGTEVLLSTEENSDYTYQWQKNSEDIDGATNHEYTATTEGQYRVLITSNTLEYTKKTQTKELTVNPLPEPEITNTDADNICKGSSTYISGSGDSESTFQWYLDNNEIDGATEKNFTADVSGSYYMEETTKNGCVSQTAPVEISVISYPQVNDIQINGEVPFCDGSSVTLQIQDSETDVSYQWYLDEEKLEGETSDELIAKWAGDYHYTVSSNLANCTSQSSPVSLEVNPSPPANIESSNGNSLCEGGDMDLIANTGYGLTYQWYKNGEVLEGEDTNILNVSQAGEYMVEVGYEGACSRESEPFEVQVNSRPSATISMKGDTELCEGSSAILTANEAPTGDTYSYQWMRNNKVIDGENNTSLEVTEGGDYKVVVTNDAGCAETSEIKPIRLKPSPIGDLLIEGNDNTFCEGQSLNLYTQDKSNYNYEWYKDGDPVNGNNAPSFEVEESGEYAVKITNTDNNCTTLSNNVNAESIVAPEASIQATDNNLSFCERDSSQLSIPENKDWSYQWIKNGTDIAGANQHSLYIREEGEYQVEIMNASGCQTLTDPVSIDLKSNPIPQVMQDGLYLSTQSYNALQWKRNDEKIEGQNDQVFRAKESGDYSVTVTHENGCRATSENVTVCKPIPEITIDGNIISASHGEKFQWFFENQPITGATQQSYRAQKSGYHSVLVTNSDGCQSMSAEKKVCIPAPTITQREEDSVLIASTGTTYQWYLEGEKIDNADTKIWVPKEEGNYTVRVTDVHECTSMSSSFEVLFDTSIQGTQKEQDIRVYPNPSRDKIHINSDVLSAKECQVTIFDIEGKKCLEQNYAPGTKEISIDISGLSKGVYLMKYQTDANTTVVSIVKK